MSYAKNRARVRAGRKDLLELVGGFIFGSFVAFTIYSAFSEEDPLQEEVARSGKKTYCEAYEEELMSSQSPEDKMHLSKVYTNLCEEEER